MSRQCVRAWIGASVLSLLFAGIAGIAGAQEFVVPPLRSAVTDEARILSPATKQNLENALRQLKDVGGTQLAVLTVPDLGGLTIEQASIRVVDDWKLGGEAEDDGVLLLVARDERRVRIEVGQGLEGSLPDAYAKRIIDEGITPLFREGDMNGGVTVGVYQIALRTNPDVDLMPYLEGQLRRAEDHRQVEGGPMQTILFLLLLFAVFSMRTGIFPWMLLGGAAGHRMGGGFGGSGGFGGGGFGGFSGGGGGFSGGGASGGW